LTWQLSHQPSWLTNPGYAVVVEEELALPFVIDDMWIALLEFLRFFLMEALAKVPPLVFLTLNLATGSVALLLDVWVIFWALNSAIGRHN
tara:strand:- start:177 stop:446 length:270 start_codon:yes stop_codon:yes gene_type:complete